MKFDTHKIKCKQKPIIGIVGGAGPDAAINFQVKLSTAMKKILKAKTDAEHYRVFIDNNTQVYETDKKSYKEGLLPPGYSESIHILKEIGASIIAVPCNSIHIYRKEIRKEAFPAHFVNMIEETCLYLANILKADKNKVGLLAINETINKHLYDVYLKTYGINLIVPDSEIQAKVLQAIAAIKAGIDTEEFSIQGQINDKFEKLSDVIIKEDFKENCTRTLKSPIDLLIEVIEHLKNKGANCILVGCSEISLMADRIKQKDNIHIIDSIDVLAERTVEVARSIENEYNLQKNI